MCPIQVTEKIWLEPIKSQPILEYPFQFVSQDLATFEGANYLVTVDHYSYFLEVDKFDDTLSRTMEHKTEAQWGSWNLINR